MTDKNDLIDHEALSLINKLSRKELTKDEVYIFNITLCDNEIDRDFEVFSEKSLEELSVLFVGKTGISDHSMRSSDQTARIFRAYTQKTPGRKTSYGEEYVALKAQAYMVRTKKNEDLIKEIDAGIKKEVSIGCAATEHICSICGENTVSKRCNHIKGKTYNDKICFHFLSGITDAYEWSFVAVPAQREAGVTKAYKIKEDKFLENPNEILKSALDSGNLTKSQLDAVYSYIDGLKAQAEDGKKYREELLSQIKSLSLLTLPELSQKALSSLLDSAETTVLTEIKSGLEKKKRSLFPSLPQTSKPQTQIQNNRNQPHTAGQALDKLNQYKI